MTEIRKADPAARKWALALLAVGVAAGVLLLVFARPLQAPLHDWLLARPERLAERLRWTVLVLGALAIVPALLVAAYLWRFAQRTASIRQFPPPGYRMLRDTPVLREAAALGRARQLRALALGLCVAAVAFALAFWRLAGAFG